MTSSNHDAVKQSSDYESPGHEAQRDVEVPT